MPVQYSGIIEEHRAVRTASGLFDIGHMARVAFDGADALAVLEQCFTNSLGTMKDGQVRYGLVCNERGGILDDILVYRFGQKFEAVINASNREKIVGWLALRGEGRDFAVRDRTFETAMIALQGPKAVDLIRGILDDDPTALKYYFARPTAFRGQPATVSRTGYTGEDGFELSVPNELAQAAWNELIDRGAVPCGLGARDTLRLEASMPLYGHELSELIDPVAAGLAWAVKSDKGDFFGRDAIANADPGRSFRIGLTLDGKRAAREGSTIHTVAGEAVGVVTSGSFVPHLERSIAMGYVPLAHMAIGTSLQVDLRGTKVPATVTKMPFYSRASR